MLIWILWLICLVVSLFLLVTWTLLGRYKQKRAVYPPLALFALLVLGFVWRADLVQTLGLGYLWGGFLSYVLLPLLMLAFFICTLLAIVIQVDDESDDWHTISGRRPDAE